jgi:DNA-binding response OmpR family regulator
LENKKILLAEDDEKFALSLVALFSSQGYETIVVPDATRAIRSATSEKINLIILDLGLPGGGGLFVVETLRRIPKTSEIPILVLTANIALGIEKKAKSVGANDFILKSKNSQELLSRMKILLA